MIKRLVCIIAAMALAVAALPASARAAKMSAATETCLACHEDATPGIVADWRASRHSRTTFEEAAKNPAEERRVSAKKVAPELASVAVGCAECHTLNPDAHRDTFDHEGEMVHPVVTPADCSTCHPAERGQYAENIMAHAYGNLTNNPIYQDLARNVNGGVLFDGKSLKFEEPDPLTEADSCLSCHGTKVEVKPEPVTRFTDFGEMEFPSLSGWPNQGVGRVNPDGSLGACTSCHPRHSFSIKIARSPATCSQCHKGPDVPAYKVYSVSKHGNIYDAAGSSWNMDAVPWVAGEHFTAPTCAACHVSLVVSTTGRVVAERTHRMNDRLPWRLFGVIYAHFHPKSPDTSIIKNAAGQPLATTLTGESASEFLIDTKEYDRRLGAMKNVCLACHATGWTDGHFDKMNETIRQTNRQTLAATQILLSAFERGIETQDSLFDGPVERKWVETWLFYANSTRLAAAMAGADYGVFANGRWQLNKTIVEMLDRLKSGVVYQHPPKGR